MEFAKALEAAGLSQQEFAEKMGVHRTVLTRVFSAKRIKPYWAWALAGLISIRTAKEVTLLEPC